jgi:N-methylhydantoinase B
MEIDTDFMCVADRSILSCWGVKGGKAGKPFQVTIDPGGPNEREVEGLEDAAPVKAGEIIRVRTTGGGGWGDPFDRPTDEVARDVRWGKVSVAGARDDYGVVLTGAAGAAVVVDEAATEALRAAKRAERDAAVAAGQQAAFFDRGPGYVKLSGGEPFPAVDLL